MSIGVLALQGDFEAHERALRELGVSSFQVRRAADLGRAAGLVMPGGESTTMLELLESEGLFEPLREYARSHPVLATCAGAILLAREVLSPAQRSLGVMDISVERNAYGRQVHSSIRLIRPEPCFEQAAGAGELEAVFIRAPIIRSIGPGVEVLARDGEIPVLVRQGRLVAATFHPELSADRRIHRLLTDTMKSAA
jgi:pyridoxal 5'-phosphate synthase pdxT subunit